MSTASRFLYKNVVKNVFFRMDPEDVHDRITHWGAFLGRHAASRRLARAAFAYGNPRLGQDVLGIRFPNPIGLSAGFDKDARLTGIIPSVGFGFMEVGSITARPCPGNPKPRLWRLPKSRSLAVYFGLKNQGSVMIARRLTDKAFAIPLGTSVAMTNCAENADMEQGIADYARAFGAFASIGHYYTVNISCPNAFGGQPFTAPDRLDRLLGRLNLIPTRKPVFLKLSPDLDQDGLDAVLDVAGRHRVHGFICANLTKPRENDRIVDAAVPPNGGLSGKVVEVLADAQIAYVYRRTQGRSLIIGSGGVFTAEDAFRKITLGASLVQLITGMVFEGPQLIGEINRGLVRLLDEHGFEDISQAVGTAQQ